MEITQPILDALLFAAERHRFQRRSGYAKLPYINHLIKVVGALYEIGKERDVVLLQAAVLHDIVEDTEVTFDELAETFSPAVAQVVHELTDDMSLPYEERRRRQLAGAADLSLHAKKIRLVDKASNITDLLGYPVDWTPARKHRYVSTAKLIVDSLRGVSPPLENWFDTVASEAEELLNIQEDE